MGSFKGVSLYLLSMAEERSIEERIENIDSAVQDIKDACSEIRMNIEDIDGHEEDIPNVADEQETIHQIWDWAEEIENSTYRWTDEDGFGFRYR